MERRIITRSAADQGVESRSQSRAVRLARIISKEMGITIAAALQFVGYYNMFLKYYIRSVLAFDAHIAYTAATDIGSQSVVTGKKIVDQIMAYVQYHPVDVAACSANLFLKEGEIQEELLQLTQTMANEQLEKIQEEARRIASTMTENLLKNKLEELIDDKLKLAAHPYNPFTANELIVPEEITDIDYIQSDLMIQGRDIRTKRERGRMEIIRGLEAESSSQVLAQDLGCRIVAGSFMETMDNLIGTNINQNCIEMLRETRTIESACPRVYQDISARVDRNVDDFIYNVDSTIQNAFVDIYTETGRGYNDILVSASVMAALLIFFVVLHVLTRAFFKSLSRGYRSVFGMHDEIVGAYSSELLAKHLLDGRSAEEVKNTVRSEVRRVFDYDLGDDELLKYVERSIEKIS